LKCFINSSSHPALLPNSHVDGQDTDFTSCFVNALSLYTVGQAGDAISIYYDAFSLEEGKQFDTGFMRGLSQSLVVVPFVTAAALRRMCAEGSTKEIDHVLLEWWLAVTLEKTGKGAVKAIMPIFCGEVSEEGHTEPNLSQ
jgi:hypothetical protein